MTEFEKLSIRDIKKGYKEKKFSPKEVISASLKRAKETSHLNHFISVLEKEALSAADLLQKRFEKGESLGSLGAIPISIKDIFTIEGVETTCGSRILKGYRPPYSATVVKKILSEGGVFIGKTNMDEFAMGSSNENSYFGPVKNPIDESRVPGGSSGGSAVAVSSGVSPVALGTDTGGSIRQPAAFCGIVGLKPTYGRVSRYGMVAYASSLDQGGPMGRTADDCAELLNAMAGRDLLDSTSLDRPVPDYTEFTQKGKSRPDLKGLKVGVVTEHFQAGLDPEIESQVKKVMDEMKRAGAEFVEIELPNTKYSVAVYYVVAVSEASSNLARFDGIHYGYRSEKHQDLKELYERTRAEGFGDEVKRRIILGTFALSSGYYDAYYSRACKVRNLIRQDFLKAFDQVDVIFSPTTPTPPFKIGEKTDDPLRMYLNDIYTIPANLAGIPGVAFPVGKTKSGLPIGAQMLGRDFDEGRLLQWTSTIEELIKG